MQARWARHCARTVSNNRYNRLYILREPYIDKRISQKDSRLADARAVRPPTLLHRLLSPRGRLHLWPCVPLAPPLPRGLAHDDPRPDSFIINTRA